MLANNLHVQFRKFIAQQK